MTSPVRVTAAVSKVLAAFLEDPEADRYGLDLMRASGHPSGTLFPILPRLQNAGWVAAGRPARRHYRLTPAGPAVLGVLLAAISAVTVARHFPRRATLALIVLPAAHPAPARPRGPMG